MNYDETRMTPEEVKAWRRNEEQERKIERRFARVLALADGAHLATGRGLEHITLRDAQLGALLEEQDGRSAVARSAQKLSAAERAGESDALLAGFERFCEQHPHLRGNTRQHQEFLRDEMKQNADGPPDPWADLSTGDRRRLVEGLRSRLRRAMDRRKIAGRSHR